MTLPVLRASVVVLVTVTVTSWEPALMVAGDTVKPAVADSFTSEMRFVVLTTNCSDALVP
jgi:hypothetical protein